MSRTGGFHSHAGTEIGGGPHGEPPPAEEGLIWVPIPRGGVCATSTSCQGPFAPVMNWLLQAVPQGWRPAPDPALLARIDALNARRAAVRPPIPGGTQRQLSGAPVVVQTTYCCVCGAVGACLGSGGADCRQLPWKQRSKGEC